VEDVGSCSVGTSMAILLFHKAFSVNYTWLHYVNHFDIEVCSQSFGEKLKKLLCSSKRGTSFGTSERLSREGLHFTRDSPFYQAIEQSYSIYNLRWTDTAMKYFFQDLILHLLFQWWECRIDGLLLVLILADLCKFLFLISFNCSF